MPAYNYQCPICHGTKLDMRTAGEEQDAPTCHKCNWPMVLLGRATGIRPAVPGAGSEGEKP